MITWLIVIGYLAVGFFVGGFAARLAFEAEQRNFPSLAESWRDRDMHWAIVCGIGAGLFWPLVGSCLLGYHLLRRYWFGDVLRGIDREERERRIADRERELGL